MSEDVTVTLKRSTWENICLSAKQSKINTVGNFWTGIQMIETYLEHEEEEHEEEYQPTEEELHDIYG